MSEKKKRLSKYKKDELNTSATHYFTLFFLVLMKNHLQYTILDMHATDNVA